MKFKTLELAWHDLKPIYSVSYHPSGRFATSGADNSVNIWCFDEGNKNSVVFLSHLERHTAPVNVVKFSPNGEYLATASDDGNVFVWKLDASKCPSTNLLFGQDSCLFLGTEIWTVISEPFRNAHEVVALDWMPDSKHLLLGSLHTVLWNIFSKQYHILGENLNFVQGIAVDPLNQCFITQSLDRTARIYFRNNVSNHLISESLRLNNIIPSDKLVSNSKSSHHSSFSTKYIEIRFRCTNIEFEENDTHSLELKQDKISQSSSLKDIMDPSSPSSSMEKVNISPTSMPSESYSADSKGTNDINQTEVNEKGGGKMNVNEEKDDELMMDYTNTPKWSLMDTLMAMLGDDDPLPIKPLEDPSTLIDANHTSRLDSNSFNLLSKPSEYPSSSSLIAPGSTELGPSSSKFPTTFIRSKSFKHAMFLDENTPSFFRRPGWSPDGKYALLPMGLFLASDNAEPQYATYIFTRDWLDPLAWIPSPSPSVAVAFSPKIYQILDHVNPDDGESNQEPTSPFELDQYRMVFAILTLTELRMYDTQHAHPIGLLQNIHFDSLTDLAWDANGENVIITSTDGYVTTLTFESGELGQELSTEMHEQVMQEVIQCTKMAESIPNRRSNKTKIPNTELCLENEEEATINNKDGKKIEVEKDLAQVISAKDNGTASKEGILKNLGGNVEESWMISMSFEGKLGDKKPSSSPQAILSPMEDHDQNKSSGNQSAQGVKVNILIPRKKIPCHCPVDLEM